MAIGCLWYDEYTRTQYQKEHRINAKNERDIMNYLCGEATKQVSVDMKKFVVMTTTGRLMTSFPTDEEAVSFCKREVKLNNEKRYVILEAKKEVGTKSPEVEIEEL